MEPKTLDEFANDQLTAAYARGSAEGKTRPAPVMVEMREGDILFRRVSNGWLVRNFVEDTEDGQPFIEDLVFEDPENPERPEGTRERAESLCKALWEVFDSYYQSKYTGGLVVRCEPKGRAEEC